MISFSDRDRMRTSARQFREQAETDRPEYREHYLSTAAMLDHAAEGRLTQAYKIAYQQLEENNLHGINLVLKALHDSGSK